MRPQRQRPQHHHHSKKRNHHQTHHPHHHRSYNNGQPQDEECVDDLLIAAQYATLTLAAPASSSVVVNDPPTTTGRLPAAVDACRSSSESSAPTTTSGSSSSSPSLPGHDGVVEDAPVKDDDDSNEICLEELDEEPDHDDDNDNAPTNEQEGRGGANHVDGSAGAAINQEDATSDASRSNSLQQNSSSTESHSGDVLTSSPRNMNEALGETNSDRLPSDTPEDGTEKVGDEPLATTMNLNQPIVVALDETTGSPDLASDAAKKDDAKDRLSVDEPENGQSNTQTRDDMDLGDMGSNGDDDDKDNDDDSSVDLENELARMTATEVDEEDDAVVGGVNPPKTANEVVDPFPTPSIPSTDLSWMVLTTDAKDEATQLQPAGTVQKILTQNHPPSTTVVIVQANPRRLLKEGSTVWIQPQEQNWTQNNDRPDENDAAWSPQQVTAVALGSIVEVFGPVRQPLYTICIPKISHLPRHAEKEAPVSPPSSNSDPGGGGGNSTGVAVPIESIPKSTSDTAQSILSQVLSKESLEAAVRLQQAVWYVPDKAERLDAELVLRSSGRGCDASNLYDEEVNDANQLDYSDDEQERIAKQRLKHRANPINKKQDHASSCPHPAQMLHGNDATGRTTSHNAARGAHGPQSSHRSGRGSYGHSRVPARSLPGFHYQQSHDPHQPQLPGAHLGTYSNPVALKRPAPPPPPPPPAAAAWGGPYNYHNPNYPHQQEVPSSGLYYNPNTQPMVMMNHGQASATAPQYEYPNYGYTHNPPTNADNNDDGADTVYYDYS